MVILESIGVAAIRWVASPLVNEGFKSLGINADKKLQELSDTVLPLLKSVIEKAEGSKDWKKVEKWLQRLKDAYDDAEDELDLPDYWRLEREAADRLRLFRVPKPPKLIMRVLKDPLDMISPRKIKLKRKLNKLQKIAREALKLRDLLGAQPDQTAAVSGSRIISVPPLKVFGREKDRDEIIRHLKKEPAAAISDPGSSSMSINTIREPGSSGIPIIAIVGRPGVGKTTLAHYIFKQLKSEGRDGHFHPIMWVHASHNFNDSEIMKNIIQAAFTASEPEDPINLDVRLERIETHLHTLAVGNLNSPNDLQQKMSTILTAKKFLLVIDDVWCEGKDHENNWKALFTYLSNCCSPGSKILVTAQTNDALTKILVAAKGAIVKKYIHDLKELEENDILDLFIHHALPGGEIDSSLRKDLEEECKTIAKKLNKDPTAAEMVGKTIALELDDLLRSKGDWLRYLRKIRENDWSGDKTEALMWSYRHLPAHLQRCFSYCSLYPRGYKFQALELVQLWMAQGFIKPDDQNKRMEKVSNEPRIEDIGNDYLKTLVSRFYIQSHGSYYMLHELLCDLAEKVSRNDCFRIEGNGRSEIPSTIRHLCIPADKLNKKKEEICKLKRLRTLIVTKGEKVISEESNTLEESGTSEENVATYIFNRLKKLRVLVLEVNIENLAEFIGEMKHLRVLQLKTYSKFVLPESVCTLYLLQVLKVRNHSSLPKRLGNLVSLRYLEANFDKISAIPDIGKLTSLQCLEKILVSKDKGNELEQLQNLNELRGRLCIANLENVKSKESAIAANLKEKKYLDELKLVWYRREDNVNSSLDVEILEGLQLPPNLTRLYLDGYRGQLLPSWPKSQASNIELWNCGMLEELPMMGQLYPSCRSLKLHFLSKLKALHTLPRGLQNFSIIDTPFLTFATNEDLQMSPAEKRSIIEVMRTSTPKWYLDKNRDYFVFCERGRRDILAAMNDFDNEAAEHNMGVPDDDMDSTAVSERWLVMHERKMELIYNRQNAAELVLPSTLTVLRLDGCNITDHALSACLQTLTSLNDLWLGFIETITCLPSEDVLSKLEALRDLHIVDCWALTSLGGIGSLPHLKELYLIGCPCLDSKTAFRSSSLEKILFETCANVDVILANAELPRLSDLEFFRCHMRTASLQFGNLPSLRYLNISDIEDCPGLSFSVDLQKLDSLEKLFLLDWSNLQELENIPSSLKHLTISGCPNLEEPLNIDPRCRVSVDGYRPRYGDSESDRIRKSRKEVFDFMMSQRHHQPSISNPMCYPVSFKKKVCMVCIVVSLFFCLNILCFVWC